MKRTASPGKHRCKYRFSRWGWNVPRSVADITRFSEFSIITVCEACNAERYETATEKQVQDEVMSNICPECFSENRHASKVECAMALQENALEMRKEIIKLRDELDDLRSSLRSVLRDI